MNKIPDYKPRWWEMDQKEKEPYRPQKPKYYTNYLEHRFMVGAIVTAISLAVYYCIELYYLLF